MSSIQELEAALAAAKKAAKEAGDEAWKAFNETVEFTWHVRWLDKYTLNIGCQYTPETVARAEQLDKEFPSSFYRISSDSRGFRGMTHMLIGNVLAKTGGGWVVLDFKAGKHGGDRWREWLELTPEQESMFRNGIVPDELKAQMH